MQYTDEKEQYFNAGDYSASKRKAGKDKRLSGADRKAAQQFRKARQNRHK